MLFSFSPLKDFITKLPLSFKHTSTYLRQAMFNYAISQLSDKVPERFGAMSLIIRVRSSMPNSFIFTNILFSVMSPFKNITLANSCISKTSIASTRFSLIWLATQLHPPGVHPRSKTLVCWSISLNRSLISSSLNAERDLQLSRLDSLTKWSFLCQFSQLFNFDFLVENWQLILLIFIMKYNGKVCLVTASSTGIGLSISERFAKEGATVIVNSRNKNNVEEAVGRLKQQGLKAEGFVCHAAKSSDIQKMVEHVQKQYGRLDVLVCNAAVSTHVGTSVDMNEDQFDKMLQVNLKGTFLLIKQAYPLLQKTKNSNIIIMASYAGYELEMGIGIYAVTKTALIAMAKLFSREFKEDEIRVNCIAPGLIKTKFSSSLWESDEEQAIAMMKVNRLGVPEDIAKVASFLGSEEASYINGETIVVAGRAGARL